MKEYGEYNNTTTGLNYTHLNNNNSNECEHVHHVPYRRIDKDDVNTWVGSSTQLYSRSNNNLEGKTSDKWEAIALCAHLTSRVSKYVNDAISSCAVKDWQWLARLVERLTHRGILWYGVIAVVIMSIYNYCPVSLCFYKILVVI